MVRPTFGSGHVARASASGAAGRRAPCFVTAPEDVDQPLFRIFRVGDAGSHPRAIVCPTISFRRRRHFFRARARSNTVIVIAHAESAAQSGDISRRRQDSAPRGLGVRGACRSEFRLVSAKRGRLFFAGNGLRGRGCGPAAVPRTGKSAPDRERFGALRDRDLRGEMNQLKALIDPLPCARTRRSPRRGLQPCGRRFRRREAFTFSSAIDRGRKTGIRSYFIDRGHAGGLVFDFGKPEVRDFLIQNARFFLEEYRVDGFRYDQVSVIDHDGAPHGWSFCQDLTARSVSPGLSR